MKKVATIGEILVEIMATTPGEGFGEAMTLTGPYPSGAPAIFIDQVGRLGQPCGMVGCVGDDDFGRLNVERLRRDGVDVSGIAVDPEAATGSAFVRYRPDGSRSFVFNMKHSASGRTAIGPDAELLLESSDHLHVMGTSLFSPALVSAIERGIALVKSRGGTVSFDPNARPEMLRLPGMREAFDLILSRADLFLPSGPELFLFSSAEREEAAIADLLARGVPALVIKRGAAGATYVDAQRRLDVPAFPVQEIDPTGAGDCFGGTFVSLWLRGMEPGAALVRAAAAGALAVTRQGPMEGTADLAEIEALVAGRLSGTVQ